MVFSGLAASILTLGIVTLAGWADATWSPVSNAEFDHAFGQTALAVGALAAHLLAQFIDVRIFHFWKSLTHGKHLWLRNNLSTIPSQIVDTSTVLVLLCAVEIGSGALRRTPLEWRGLQILGGTLDTPLVYLRSDG